MDLTKLGRTERVLAIVGLIAFIDTFLPWWDVSAKGSLGDLGAAGSASGNAWDVGFWAWFPMLLLLALGLLVALPAIGRPVVVRGGYAAFGAAALLATIITIFLLILYSPVPSEFSAYVDDSPSFGAFVGLILGIVAVAFSYISFTAAGGDIKKFGDAFKAQPAPETGYVPPAGGYAPPPSFGTPPGDQPAPGTWQQPPQQ